MLEDLEELNTISIDLLTMEVIDMGELNEIIKEALHKGLKDDE